MNNEMLERYNRLLLMRFEEQMRIGDTHPQDRMRFYQMLQAAMQYVMERDLPVQQKESK